MSNSVHWSLTLSFIPFILATEAHDDDGLPHTLEHIVFMGSEKYPYKVWSLNNFFSHIIY